MHIITDWSTPTSYPLFSVRNSFAWVFTLPEVLMQEGSVQGSTNNIHLVWPDSVPADRDDLRFSLNLAIVQRLLNNCYTRDDEGVWQNCERTASAPELREIIEAGGEPLDRSCYTCAVRAVAGAPLDTSPLERSCCTCAVRAVAGACL